MLNQLKRLYLLPASLLVLLVGCNDSNNSPMVISEPDPMPVVEFSYQVEVTNLTYAQPFSPLAVVLHDNTTLWNIGESASAGLEMLAEGGDTSAFMADQQVLAMASNDGILLPGASALVTITTSDEMATYFTLATMLVNTNDAFSGLTGIDLSLMALDQSQSWTLGAYDAGSEMNSEMAGTMPGPADGGTGFDENRDDVDFVAMHPGIVSSDDGLTTSTLTQAHRFDGPVLKLTLTRIK